MPSGNTSLDYQTVCKYAGQLFLETRLELERSAENSSDLQLKLATALKERDDALRLLMEKQRAVAPA